MDYHIILFIAMMTVFISYISFIWIKYGVQSSISQSYYALPKDWNILFTLFCWGFAFPAIILGVEVTGLMFFAGAGIAFVGAAAAIKDTFVEKVHTIAATSGIIFSQLAIFFGYHMWELNVASIVIALLVQLLVKKNTLWWVEIVAFLTMAAALFMHLQII